MKLKKLSSVLVLLLSIVAIFSAVSITSSAASKPATPTGLKATGYYNYVNLDWKDVSGADGYVVYQYQSGKYVAVATTKSSFAKITTDYLESGLYRVKAYDRVGSTNYYSNYSDYARSLSAPLPVTTLKYSNLEINSITLSWNQRYGARGYVIYAAKNGSSTYTKLALSSGSSITLKNLDPNTTYSFRVKSYYKDAYSVFSYGSYSPEVKVKTALSAVDNFKIKTTGVDKQSYTWDAVPSARAYQVWIKQEGDSAFKFYKLSSTTSTTTAFAEGTGVAVRAYYMVSPGKYVYGKFSVINIVPSDVKNLKVTSGVKSATLTWSSAFGAEGYKVLKYNESKKTYETFALTKSTSYKATLGDKQTYKFAVLAYNINNGEVTLGGRSNDVTFMTTPTAVPKLSYSDVEYNSATLTWSAVDNIYGYVVYYAKAGQNYFTKLAVTRNTTYDVSKLIGNQEYLFAIKAYCYEDGVYGFASYSPVVRFKTTLSTIDTLEVIAGTTSLSTRTFTWEPTPSARGYQIWMAQEGSGVYTLSTVTWATTVTVNNLYQNMNVNVKIRPYQQLSNGSYVYGAFSSALKVQTGMNPVADLKLVPSKTDGRTIALSWTTSPAKISGYYVFIKTPGGSYNHVKTLSATTNSYEIRSCYGELLEANSPYEVCIRAFYGSVMSPYAELEVETGDIKSTSIQAQDVISICKGEASEVFVKFLPLDTTSKSFTIIPQDFTYKYGGVYILGIWIEPQKTNTLKWEDYFKIDSKTNTITAIKETITPALEGSKEVSFSFDVTIKANDSGKTTTSKVSIVGEKLLNVNASNSKALLYGDTTRLTYTLGEDSDYKTSDVIWKSSDTDIATIDETTGTVKCVGVGKVNFTAAVKGVTDGRYVDSISKNISAVVDVADDYFDKCVVGKTYQIDASFAPVSTGSTPMYMTSDSEALSVTSTGLVTFKDNKGGAIVVVDSKDQSNFRFVYFTSGTFTVPSGSTTELLTQMQNYTKDLKVSIMPAFIRSDVSYFSDFDMSNPSKDYDIGELFTDGFAEPKESFVRAVNANNYPDAGDLANAQNDYVKSIPVANQQSVIIPGINTAYIKSLNVVDKGYCFDYILTLNDEYMHTLPSSYEASTQKTHGKIFDVLTSDYINNITKAFEEQNVTISYSKFAQTYHDSTVTLTINKLTNTVENINYNMKIDVDIENLELKFGLIKPIDSDLAFTVENCIDIDFYAYNVD